MNQISNPTVVDDTNDVAFANNYIGKVFRALSEKITPEKILEDPDLLKLAMQLNNDITNNFTQLKRLNIEEKNTFSEEMIDRLADKYIEQFKQMAAGEQGSVIQGTYEERFPDDQLPPPSVSPERLIRGTDFRGSFDDLAAEFNENGKITRESRAENNERLITSDPMAIIPPDLKD